MRQRSRRQQAATQLLTLRTIMGSQKGQAWKTAYEALRCDGLFFCSEPKEQAKVQLAIVDARGYVLLQTGAKTAEWPLLWGAICGLHRCRPVLVWDRASMHSQLQSLGVDENHLPPMICLQSLYRTVSKRRVIQIDDALAIEGLPCNFSGSPAAVDAQKMVVLTEHLAMEWEQHVEMRDYLRMYYGILSKKEGQQDDA